MGHKRKRQALEATAASPPAKKHNSSSITKPPVASITLERFQDEPDRVQLKREADLYYDKLSSENPDVREEAEKAIVFGFGLLEEDGVSEATLLRHLDRRLFGGLASSRNCARLGCSIVVTEILAQLFRQTSVRSPRYASISMGRLLGILKAKVKPEGDLSGQEERDHYLGLLFGLQCFVKAEVLFGKEDKTWQEIFKQLIELAKKKPWVKRQCGQAIVDALAQMDLNTAEKALDLIQSEGFAFSPEGVAIWLEARRHFPEMKFPSKPWGTSGNPLEHLTDLAKALKESSSVADEKRSDKVQQTGTWNPQPHFAWDLVFDQYIQDANNDKDDAQTLFDNFWKKTVDDSLFSNNASPERKFWGFALFQSILRKTATIPRLLPAIFSPNLVRSLINHASKEDRFLNRAASKSLKTMVEVSEEHPEAIPVILSGLVSGANGVYNFDRVTRSKTIDGILSYAGPEVAEATVKALLEPAQKAAGEERDVEARRQLFGDHLISLIRRTDMSSPASSRWVSELGLPVLAQFAYSTKGHAKYCQPALTEKTRTLFRNRLSAAFAHVLSARNGFSYPSELLGKLVPDAVTMDIGISSAKEDAISTMNKLAKKTKKADEKEQTALQALSLLYALMIFQLYNGEADAISVLDELKICYDKLVRHKDTEDDVEASEVLVEILLSLISRPSKLLKRTGQLVFEAFTEEVTEGGLKLLTDVLETSESLKGQQEMFDQNQDDEDMLDEPEDDEEELDSDVEVIDVEDADEESGDDEEDDEDDEDDGGEEDDGAENRALDAALEAALGTHRLDKDLDAEDSDSDADMTDSEMIELDKKLVEIFSRQKKQPNKKKEKKEARENIINFKSSVLDLLDIYVKKEPATSFQLLIPILTTVRTSTSKDVSSKAHSVIGSFAAAVKKVAVDTDIPEVEKLPKLLKALHKDACKDPNASQAYAKASSSASLAVCSCAFRASGRSEVVLEKLLDVYKKTSLQWAMGQKKIHPTFFSEWQNWLQSIAMTSVN